MAFHCPTAPWLGEAISVMLFAHWLAIVTIPSAVFGGIGLLISLILKFKTSRTEVSVSRRPTAVFYRSRSHKLIAGVCAAIAQQWSLPLQGVRIATAILAVIVPGFVVLLLYFWFWLAFPSYSWWSSIPLWLRLRCSHWNSYSGVYLWPH